eukprot:jgi/Botrbrau1/3646/Bobra.0204s0036.1
MWCNSKRNRKLSTGRAKVPGMVSASIADSITAPDVEASNAAENLRDTPFSTESDSYFSTGYLSTADTAEYYEAQEFLNTELEPSVSSDGSETFLEHQAVETIGAGDVSVGLDRLGTGAAVIRFGEMGEFTNPRSTNPINICWQSEACAEPKQFEPEEVVKTSVTSSKAHSVLDLEGMFDHIREPANASNEAQRRAWHIFLRYYHKAPPEKHCLRRPSIPVFQRIVCDLSQPDNTGSAACNYLGIYNVLESNMFARITKPDGSTVYVDLGSSVGVLQYDDGAYIAHSAFGLQTFAGQVPEPAEDLFRKVCPLSEPHHGTPAFLSMISRFPLICEGLDPSKAMEPWSLKTCDDMVARTVFSHCLGPMKSPHIHYHCVDLEALIIDVKA